jgi:DNA-binding response OmpR family regulator
MPSVIIITAGHIDDKALILMPAVKQIVTKPFHVRDLLEVIHKWAV